MANRFTLKEIETAVKKAAGVASLRSKRRFRYLADARAAYYFVALQLTGYSCEEIADQIGFCRRNVFHAKSSAPNDESQKIMVNAAGALYEGINFCDMPKQARMPWHG